MLSFFLQVFSSNAESFDVRIFLCGCCCPSINIFWPTSPASCRCFQACERVTDPGNGLNLYALMQKLTYPISDQSRLSLFHVGQWWCPILSDVCKVICSAKDMKIRTNRLTIKNLDDVSDTFPRFIPKSIPRWRTRTLLAHESSPSLWTSWGCHDCSRTKNLNWKSHSVMCWETQMSNIPWTPP